MNAQQNHLTERERELERRHDRLWVTLHKQIVQATRQEPAKDLGSMWCGHSCVGNVMFKTLDGARKFAEGMGYEGILL